jgi:hypothetical protein
MANMYGINLARFQLNNNYKTNGFIGEQKRLMIFTSEQVLLLNIKY